MKRIILALLAGVTSIALASCGGGTVDVVDQEEPASTSQETAPITPESERQPLQITASGYWFDEYNTGHYGIMISNPNQGWAAENFQLSVTGKDDAGNIVGNTSERIGVIFANGQNGFAGETYIDGATSLEFQIIESSNDWVEQTVQQGQFDKEFYVQNVHESSSENGNVTVSGEAVNTTEGEFSLTKACAIFLDENGSIVGGDWTFIETLAPGATVPFSIDYIEDVPPHSSVAVYLDCGFMTNQ